MTKSKNKDKKGEEWVLEEVITTSTGLNEKSFWIKLIFRSRINPKKKKIEVGFIEWRQADKGEGDYKEDKICTYFS